MLVRVSLTTATHAHINTHWVWSSMWSVPRAELGWWLPGYCWPGNIFSAEDEEEKRKKKKKNSIQLTRTPGQSLTTAIRCFTCYYSWDWSLFCGTDGKRDSLSFKASLSPLTLLSYECVAFSFVFGPQLLLARPRLLYVNPRVTTGVPRWFPPVSTLGWCKLLLSLFLPQSVHFTLLFFLDIYLKACGFFSFSICSMGFFLFCFCCCKLVSLQNIRCLSLSFFVCAFISFLLK